MVGGRRSLAEVMTLLSEDRPVFHSEADLQFAFAQCLGSLEPDIDIRLEVPQRRAETTRREYVDLVCRAKDTQTLVEFKHVTRSWSGRDPRTGEEFGLRSHSATDLARLHLLHDVTRWERWTTEQVAPQALPSCSPTILRCGLRRPLPAHATPPPDWTRTRP